MDPYKILELDNTATAEQIRRAYLRLADLHHPDRGGDPKVFKRIQEAYEELLKRPPPSPQPKDIMQVEEPATPIPRSDFAPPASLKRKRSSHVASRIVSAVAIVIAAIVVLIWLLPDDNNQVLGTRTGPAPLPRVETPSHRSSDSGLRLSDKPTQAEPAAQQNFSTTQHSGQDEVVVKPVPEEQIPSAGSVDPAELVKQKLAIPSDSEQVLPRRRIAELFKQRYEEAKSSESKLDLASQMIAAALDEVDVATRFSLLDIAKGIGIQQMGLAHTIQCAEELEATFDIPEGSEQKAVLLRAANQFSKSTEQTGAGVELMLLLSYAGSVALEKQQFADAKDYFNQAAVVAGMIDRRGQATRLTAMVAEVERKKNQRDRLSAAREVLAVNPDDPDANLVVGLDYCAREEWQSGFEHLSRITGSELSELANLELEDDKQVLELADRWWTLESDDQAVKAISRLRAEHYYAIAVRTATGLEKVKIESRFASLEEAIGDRMAFAPATDEAMHSADSDPASDSDKIVSSQVKIGEFTAYYRSLLTEIASLDTQIQRKAATNALEERLNKFLKSQIWTIRFPIKDIAKTKKRDIYTLALEKPQNILVEQFRFQDKAVAKLSERRAFSIIDGRFEFEISGRPRFTLRNLESHLLEFTFGSGGCVLLTDGTTRVVELPKKEPPDASAKLQQETPVISRNQGIMVENSPIDFIPLDNSAVLPITSEAARFQSHYVVKYRGDRAMVRILNVPPRAMEVEVEMTNMAGSSLSRPGLNGADLSNIATLPQVVISWANKSIVAVTVNDKVIPPVAEYESVPQESLKQLRYALPSRSQDAVLFAKALVLIESQVQWVRMNRAPEGYVAFEKALLDGHDTSTLLPLRIDYSPVVSKKSDFSLELTGEQARVALDAGTGKDGVSRVVIATFQRALNQPWVGDDMSKAGQFQCSSVVEIKDDYTPGRFLDLDEASSIVSGR